MAKLTGVDDLVDCPLVAVSVYDTKPVHFLTMCTDEIKWVTKKRLVWDHSSGMMTEAEFLRLSVNNNYNAYMSMVDQADQLRGYYRPDRFLRQNKWWWSIYFWAHGTVFVNVYCLYRAYMTFHGKNPLPHYEFRRRIILAKLDPLKYLPKQIKCTSKTSKFISASAQRTSIERSERMKRLWTDSSYSSTRSKKKKEETNYIDN